jgi:hypothetical protein
MSEVYADGGVLVEKIDATGHHYLRDGAWVTEPLTDEEAREVAADAALQATADTQAVAHAEAEVLRQQMFALTDQIIDWCQDAQAFLYTAGAQGVFSPQAFMVLLQTAEGYLLTFKALPVKTQAVTEQRDWMLQRGQQAQSILALAAVMA